MEGLPGLVCLALGFILVGGLLCGILGGLFFGRGSCYYGILRYSGKSMDGFLGVSGVEGWMCSVWFGCRGAVAAARTR